MLSTGAPLYLPVTSLVTESSLVITLVKVYAVIFIILDINHLCCIFSDFCHATSYWTKMQSPILTVSSSDGCGLVTAVIGSSRSEMMACVFIVLIVSMYMDYFTTFLLTGTQCVLGRVKVSSHYSDTHVLLVFCHRHTLCYPSSMGIVQ